MKNIEFQKKTERGGAPFEKYFCQNRQKILTNKKKLNKIIFYLDMGTQGKKIPKLLSLLGVPGERTAFTPQKRSYPCLPFAAAGEKGADLYV
ncbi:MAG: hypothetical protein IIV90_03860 [Oscillospiraceae bacterium]|nr:hypothetical protein [Oscillospiraceae bacterium]